MGPRGRWGRQVPTHTSSAMAGSVHGQEGDQVLGCPPCCISFLALMFPSLVLLILHLADPSLTPVKTWESQVVTSKESSPFGVVSLPLSSSKIRVGVMPLGQA